MMATSTLCGSAAVGSDGAVTSSPLPLVGDAPGIRTVDVTRAGRRSRFAVLFHPPLRELVQARIRFALDHQRAGERADSRRAA